MTLQHITAFLFLSGNLMPASPAETVSVEELFKPRTTLAMKVKSSGGKVDREGSQWRITGKAPFIVVFVPSDGDKWDLSSHRLAGLPFVNKAGGILTIRGRLTNSGETGWSNHAPGFCVAPSGEKATLGFPFSVAEDRYHGPAVFKDQLAKANGHRVHWRTFQPEVVRSLVLEFRSSVADVDVLLGDAFLAWPASEELDSRLSGMPYLDAMGQVRAVDWPGKAQSIEQARTALLAEYDSASAAAKNRRLSPYGGWLDGPKLESTGRFRTAKVDGKWWLVDPEGRLFFSVGACMAGSKSETVIHPLRRTNGFFAYIPGEDDPLKSAGLQQTGNRLTINYPSLNYARFLGQDWPGMTRDGDHNRMRAWGLNTLGCWSDEGMQKDRRTPYTLIASPWWRTGKGGSGFPSPFSEKFEAELRSALEKHLWAEDDPWLLGVFLGNELEWPDEFSPMLFELAPGHPTKAWAIGRMKEKHGELAALNAAWRTDHKDWAAILTKSPDAEIRQAVKDDLEPLYAEFAATFFKRCKSALNAVLPGALYLGCRTHRGPNVIGRGAAGHVDIFSVNVYDCQVRSSQVPAGVDMPIMAGEFHFGAVDRGVPGPGLSAVWDQRQRGLAFAHYLASALADPRFVGVHWFQWLDQNAAGRSDRENHECGFLDVTGRSYPEFVQTVARVTARMYEARSAEKKSMEQTLEMLLRP